MSVKTLQCLGIAWNLFAPSQVTAVSSRNIKTVNVSTSGASDCNTSSVMCLPRSVRRRTSRQDAQAGADVRPETVHSAEALPEGLARERKDPLNKSSGRR